MKDREALRELPIVYYDYENFPALQLSQKANLGSVMVTMKAVEAANIRFVVDKLRMDRTGNTLESMVIPIAEQSLVVPALLPG